MQICLGPVCVPLHLLLPFLVALAHQHGYLTWFKVKCGSADGSTIGVGADFGAMGDGGLDLCAGAPPTPLWL